MAGCFPIQRDCKTFDNFLHYDVALRYFPSLREIDIDLSAFFDGGKQSFLSASRRLELGMADYIRPFFIRAADGRGFQFLTTPNRLGRPGWEAMKIYVMEKREAARHGDGEDPLKRKVFLDYLVMCIWHVFKPQKLLWDDGKVIELLGSKHTPDLEW